MDRWTDLELGRVMRYGGYPTPPPLGVSAAHQRDAFLYRKGPGWQLVLHGNDRQADLRFVMSFRQACHMARAHVRY